MARDLDVDLQAETEADELRPAFLAVVETASGYVQLWSGLGDLRVPYDTFAGPGLSLDVPNGNYTAVITRDSGVETIEDIEITDGNGYAVPTDASTMLNTVMYTVYDGVSDLMGISAVEESDGLEVNGVKFTLSGIPSDKILMALDDIQWGREAKVYFATLSTTDWSLVGDPYLLFNGKTDVAEIDEGAETSTIMVSAENRLIDLERPRLRRYTTEDQQIDFPGDLGFEYVPYMKDSSVIFGVA